MTEEENAPELSPFESFIQRAKTEAEDVRKQLKEIGMLVEQSQGEVDKLAARNADLTSRIHQMHAHFDTVPREDIKEIYDSALDAQQRLFTMRGQLEKLESDQKNLTRLAEFMAELLRFAEGEALPESDGEEGEAEAGGTLLARVVQAQEEERSKISRQIHDGPAQVLANFILQTEIAERLLKDDPEKAAAELASLKEAATSSFSKVRDFIFDLRPMMLDDLGLIPTARRYIEGFKEKTGLEVSMVITGNERRLESFREVVIFRALQELLGNVRDHAQATQAKVQIDLDEHNVRAAVEDNGRGFDPESLEVEDRTQRTLRYLSRQIELLGGTIEIDSREGEGTRVSFSVPTGD